ncbi:MAG: hypothetical protein N2254_07565 [bacterium]|nr:hypothetical protein [bacterium]
MEKLKIHKLKINSKSVSILIFVISFGYFIFQLISKIELIGTIEDEIYIKDRNRVVGIIKENGEYKILFNEHKNTPNNAIAKELWRIKIVSQSLPPMGLIVLNDIEFPLLIWFHTGFLPYTIQNIFMIKYEVLFARIPCVIFGILIVPILILIFRKSGLEIPSVLFGVSLFLISSSFLMFLVQSSSFTYLLCSFLLTISIYFLINRNFLLSFIALGMLSLSYIKFGINLFLSYLVVLSFLSRDIKDTIRNFSFMSILTLIFTLPYIIHSIAFYELDEVLPRAGDISFFSFFPRTTLKFILSQQTNQNFFESIKIGFLDLMELIGNIGFGKHLVIDYNYSASKISFVFILVFIFCIIDKNLRLVSAIILIYTIFESITFPHYGFPRRFLVIFPIFISSIGIFIWNQMQKKYGVLFFTIPIFYVFLQTQSLTKFVKKLETEGVSFQNTSMEIQKEIKDFIFQQNITEISNFSALINLDVITEGNIKIYDWSYSILWGNIKPELIPHILKLNEGKYILLSWLKPHSEIEKISNRYNFSLVKIKSFERAGKEIFSISKIEKKSETD